MAKFNKHVQFGPPVAFNEGIEAGMLKVVQKHKNVVAVMEDMGMPAIDWFKKNAPTRIVQCGIAEANGAVIASGLASEGYMPFLFGNFAVFVRAYNQIRQSILIDRYNVKIAGRGGSWGIMGISHSLIESTGAARVLPNLVIINVADAVEAEKAWCAMADYYGPVYFRMEVDSPPPITIFSKDYDFEIGKAYTIKTGKDATIIASGYMVTEAIRAIDILEKDGLDVGILNMSTLKPLDEEAIIKAAEETRAIITVENGTIIGGLAEGVAAVLSKNMPAALETVGLDDEFSQSGKITPERDDLKIHFGLRPEDIALSVKECIAKREKFKLVRK